MKKRGPTFLVGLVFAVFCFLVANVALEYTSRSRFCGTACHEMTPAYTTWELSSHGANRLGFRVECIQCHLPPKEHCFAHVAAKSYTGVKDVYKHFLGGDYDLEKVRGEVAQHLSSQRCLYCHDSLLTKPASSASRKAHLASLEDPGLPENRCVECHEDVGHQRHEKLFLSEEEQVED